MKAAPRTHGVDSARKVLQILLMFNEDSTELSIDDIVERFDSSVSSSYRYLALLKELGFVEERSRGAYVLTPRVLALARAAERALDLVEASRSALVDLATSTGETALVLRRVNWSAVCVERVQPDSTIRLSFAPGSSMPLHAGAGAKVLLAAMTRDQQRMYLDGLSVRELSRADRAALETELVEIRDTGRSESHAEVDAEIWAFASPVKVGIDVVAAVSVAGPDFRLDERRRARIRNEVEQAALRISAALSRGDASVAGGPRDDTA